jgi:hypothetical protein
LQASAAACASEARVYIAPQHGEDSEEWDEVSGTHAELMFAEEWLNTLTFIPGWRMWVWLAGWRPARGDKHVACMCQMSSTSRSGLWRGCATCLRPQQCTMPLASKGDGLCAQSGRASRASPHSLATTEHTTCAAVWHTPAGALRTPVANSVNFGPVCGGIWQKLALRLFFSQPEPQSWTGFCNKNTGVDIFDTKNTQKNLLLY